MSRFPSGKGEPQGAGEPVRNPGRDPGQCRALAANTPITYGDGGPPRTTFPTFWVANRVSERDTRLNDDGGASTWGILHG